MSKLESDQLLLIFEKLSNDKKSLYSCLLVNKFWSQILVKILWKDPWTSLLKEDGLEKAKLFFRTVLSQLPQDSRKFLMGRKIKLPEQQKPFFDYISNCKYIGHIYSADGKKDNDIYDYVFSDYSDTQRIELKKEIYKLFINKCTALTYLDLTNINYPLYEFPGAETNLSKITHLRFDDKSSQLINGLSKICKFIEKFDVNLTCSNSNLIKFIQVQENLKSIIIRDNNNEQNLEKPYEIVGEAIIEQHKDNLIHLDLTLENNVSFYNNLLLKLINVKKIVLYDSRYRNVAIHKQLKFSDTYPNLKVLQIGISFSVAVKIIQATKDTIQMIWLDKGNQESEEQISQLLKAISQHCQYLKFLKICLKNENLEDFKQLLIICKYLEGLYIYRGNIYNDDDGKGLLDVLVDSANNNLYKLQLHYCYFKIDTLNQFFKRWKGRKSLYLYPILANYYENKLLSREEFNRNKKRFNDMIESYKKENVIKTFETSHDFMFKDLAEFKY
ncbi:hypothetical protein C1645_792383 [Glomus cerebriforme]|uniref:F-box domain-containing protein n=1 Tax=Glomus cerebriforme TaxID=658196 RepID=A0A397SCS4_9GLOM|nr:hypothetical protein C1645_792383 [Glomus cerebriforme]